MEGKCLLFEFRRRGALKNFVIKIKFANKVETSEIWR